MRFLLAVTFELVLVAFLVAFFTADFFVADILTRTSTSMTAFIGVLRMNVILGDPIKLLPLGFLVPRGDRAVKVFIPYFCMD